MTIENIAIGRYVTIATSRIPWAYCCRGYIVGGDKVAGTIQVFIEKDHGDCEFYTFFVEEVDLAIEEPLFASVQDCMQPMQPADLSALKHLTPPPSRRPLSSLTEGEINNCYKQAMGVDYDVERIERSDTHSSITAYVGKDYLSLDEIDGHVRVSATIFFDGWEYPAMMRMTPLVRYLDSIGIEIGA